MSWSQLEGPSREPEPSFHLARPVSVITWAKNRGAMVLSLAPGRDEPSVLHKSQMAKAQAPKVGCCHPAQRACQCGGEVTGR